MKEFRRRLPTNYACLPGGFPVSQPRLWDAGVVLANKAVYTSANDSAFRWRSPSCITPPITCSSSGFPPSHHPGKRAMVNPAAAAAAAAAAATNRTRPSSRSPQPYGRFTMRCPTPLYCKELGRPPANLKVLVTPLIVLLELGAGVRQGAAAQARASACSARASPRSCATVSDVSFELTGALTALLSCSVSAVLKVLQQDVLQRRGWSSLELMRRTWGPQTLLLAACMPLLDGDFAKLASYHLTTRRLARIGLSCGAAFLLNVSSLVAIKMTSAIAIVLLSQGKTITTMLLGFLFFDGHPTSMQLAGAGLALLSLSAYTYASTVGGGGGGGGGGRGSEEQQQIAMMMMSIGGGRDEDDGVGVGSAPPVASSADEDEQRPLRGQR